MKSHKVSAQKSMWLLNDSHKFDDCPPGAIGLTWVGTKNIAVINVSVLLTFPLVIAGALCLWKSSRPVLFVVQLMSDISKQDCIHNKRVPQCTKMRFSIHHK